MDIVQELDDDLYICKLMCKGFSHGIKTFIVYLMVETTQCLLKKARDLCILVAERSEVISIFINVMC